MILLLAGTAEAAVLARALAEAEIAATASLAGATRAPKPLPLPTRIGGFGGTEGFARWLDTERPVAVIDATHPFAARITARTAAVCAARRLPFLRLERPGWTAAPGDRWHRIAREEEAGALIPVGASVFLATGRQSLPRFAGLAGRRLHLRLIDPPDGPFPLPGGDYLIGRPPFAVADEIRLFRDLGVEWLVVKDAGGAESRSKLDAARHLGLPVAMLDRPPAPDCARVETVAAALDWARRLAGRGDVRRDRRA